jgi:hypothetical protein
MLKQVATHFPFRWPYVGCLFALGQFVLHKIATESAYGNEKILAKCCRSIKEFPGACIVPYILKLCSGYRLILHL